MQFTVVANESNRELQWQGASYSGGTARFCLAVINIRVHLYAVLCHPVTAALPVLLLPVRLNL